MAKDKVRSMVVAEAPIDPVRQTNVRFINTISGDVIPFGLNNLFPNELAAFLRQSKIQRGIVNDKADRFSGTKFTNDDERFNEWAVNVGFGKSLFDVHYRLNLDRRFSGNSFIHVITNAKKDYVLIEHLDFTKCRVNTDHEIVVNPNWVSRDKTKDVVLPLFPEFAKGDDGQYHAGIHIKDYEPEFTYYGIPDWITGYDNMKIDIKTDEWNLSHIDKGMKPDLVLVLPAGTTEKEIELIRENLKDFKEGQPGSAFFLFGDGAKATVVNEKTMDMDWQKLNEVNIDKAIIANAWYKSLMSISQQTGFDTERVLYDYQLALFKIEKEQQLFLSVYKKILGAFNLFNVDNLQIHNTSIIPEESPEDRLMKMKDFFTEEQQRQIGDLYFKEIIEPLQ